MWKVMGGSNVSGKRAGIKNADTMKIQKVRQDIKNQYIRNTDRISKRE